MGGPEKPVPTWTCWPDKRADGTPMANVQLDVGQFSFKAAGQYDPSSPESFPQQVQAVMTAITYHAIERGWIVVEKKK